MSIWSVMPSNHFTFLLPPSIFPSIRVFSNELVLHSRWPKYWSFSFSISPFNEYSGLISFRMDWLDLLAVQGTLRSLLQHHRAPGMSTYLLTPILITKSIPSLPSVVRIYQASKTGVSLLERGSGNSTQACPEINRLQPTGEQINPGCN